MIPCGKILLAILLAATATAQQKVGVHAGMVNYAEGFFSIDETVLQFPDARFRVIPEGASLRTGAGWVEVMLGPYAYGWIGRNASLRMEDSNLENIQILLEQGSVVVDVFGEAKGNHLSIRFGDTVIEPLRPGRYRLDGESARLSVYSGKGEIRRADKKKTIGSGRSAALSGDLKAAGFDARKTDELQEIALTRARVLSRELSSGRLRNQPVEPPPESVQQEPKPTGWDRLKLEHDYQEWQKMQQTRPLGAGPHPQPWEQQPPPQP